MFRCQMCGKVSGAGVKSKKVVVATREREYKGNLDEFPQRRGGRFREPRKPRDRGGRGHEIVKELMVCTACAEAHNQKAAAAAEAAAKAKAEAALLSATEVPVAVEE